MIPSLPISYLDALPILKALKGHGPKAKKLGESWKGSGLEYEGLEYYVGPSPESVALNLWNEQEYVAYYGYANPGAQTAHADT